MPTLPDSVARAARTFLQTSIAVFLSLVTLPHAAPGVVPGWDALKTAGVAALFAGATATLSLVQNMLEDRGALPTLLKPPPPQPPATPINF